MPISVAYFSTLVEEGWGRGARHHSRFLFSVRSFACVGVITLCKQGSLCRKKCIEKNLICIIFEELIVKLMLPATWTISILTKLPTCSLKYATKSAAHDKIG